MTLREKLMHYTYDLDCGSDLKQEAIATIEHIAQYMDEDELLHHSRPLALAYLALTEDASVGRGSRESSVVRGLSTFPDRLRRLRERQQLKRCVLSELCGLNRNTIKRYEMGTQKPSMDALISIADYFGVSIDYLLGRSDYPKSL